MRAEAIVLQKHQSFLQTVISDRLLLVPPQTRPRQFHPALRLLRIRRETGRQEGHLRGIDAKDIRALLTGRRGEEEEDEEEGTGFRERKINISLAFIVLISEMITQFAVCSTE